VNAYWHPSREGQVIEQQRRAEYDTYEPEGIAAIAPVTWLWLLASGFAFWLAVVESVVWLV
jgi:hypothetical protein